MKNSIILSVLLISSIILSCSRQHGNERKVWAWMSGKTTMTPENWEHYFKNASDAGIDAIILECHGGYPEVIGDSASFRDSAAIYIVKTALQYSQKYNIELHAWIWTTNRTEMSLRNAHPDWYQVNAQGESCLDIKLYNREHYRWLCPSRPEATEYLKDRVSELAEIDGLAGIHLDFIRYPDAILPYGLHKSRNVVQDRVYPLWDFCYCDECRKQFKERSGVDPMDIEDPTADEKWMQFRWDALAKMASEVAKEIKAHGKTSSAAVFASPEESKKLVRQDWANFKNVDILFPMIYHKFYDWEDQDIERATREGVEALRSTGSKAILTSGLFVGHVPKERINEFFNYAKNGGSKGICLFSLELVDRTDGYWERLKEAIKIYKGDI
ncbi:MAG: hypothetical protein BGO30_05655 [Bacteroidetes bacterium 41-46]|mgnify:FL=1|nr:MAG: hypothetical protein BGO30_05655 [Bacteroidetes bacterium 41-46]